MKIATLHLKINECIYFNFRISYLLKNFFQQSTKTNIHYFSGLIYFTAGLSALKKFLFLNKDYNHFNTFNYHAGWYEILRLKIKYKIKKE